MFDALAEAAKIVQGIQETTSENTALVADSRRLLQVKPPTRFHILGKLLSLAGPNAFQFSNAMTGQSVYCVFDRTTPDVQRSLVQHHYNLDLTGHFDDTTFMVESILAYK